MRISSRRCRRSLMRPRSIPTVLFAAAALGTTARHAQSRQVEPPEERCFRVVNDAPDGLRAPAWLVMQTGSLATVFGVAWALRARKDRRALPVLVAGTAAWGGIKLIKPLVGRGRPADHLDHVNIRGGVQSGLGYPSGHAAVAATLVIVTAPIDSPFRAVAPAFAVATGIARMYVGAHLPLDVMGGLATGVIVGIVGNEIGSLR